MIGIIGAMRVEVEQLLRGMENTEARTVSGREFYRGRLRGQDVVVVQCGVGKVNAAMCAEAMILAYQPSLIINVGVAGALTGRLKIGDIAVARDLVQHDVDTTAFGDPIGLVSTVNRVDFPCAEWAVKAIVDTIDTCHGLRGTTARIASGDQFISERAQKQRIIDLFQADVCEMEGCAIAQVCYINSVDCVVIRAISDATDGGHVEDFTQFCNMAAENSAKLLMAFLEKLA